MEINKEYEYSFRVKEAKWFKQKCRSMNPDNTRVIVIDRIVYKNSSKIIARITIEENNKSKELTLDFKQDTPDGQLVKNARESSGVKISIANISEVKGLLKNMGYKESIRLKKKRTTYQFNKIKVEIDEYIEPELAVVIEIEGNKKLADDVYRDIYNENMIFYNS